MDTTRHLSMALARLAEGEAAARDELFLRTQNRLRRLLGRYLHRDFPRLAELEQTDDLLQDVHVRLLKSWDHFLQDEQGRAIQEPAVFFSRVSRLMREVLLDCARRHFGRAGERRRVQRFDPEQTQVGTPVFGPAPDAQDPEVLAQLTEFHRAVEALPPPLRQVIDLHWYQELPHAEVAVMLGLGESTVRKYWVKARLSLIDQLGENPFSGPST